MTTSTPTRPKTRVSSATSSSSRGVRAAKSAWPPSDANGTKRPSEIVQHADAHAGAGSDDRGVAARYGDALLQDGQLVRLEHRYGIGERFEVVDDLDTLRLRPVATASASTSHGTFVSRAT